MTELATQPCQSRLDRGVGRGRTNLATTTIAAGAAQQSLAEILEQLGAPARMPARVLLNSGDATLRISTPGADVLPHDGATVRSQLALQSFGCFANVGGNARDRRALCPESLEQLSRRESDIELTAVKLGVPRSPEQHASREAAVPTGTTGFLVIGFGRRRECPVDDLTNIRLIDP